MALQAKRVEPGTYRIGSYVAFQLNSGAWRLGEPIYHDEPTAALRAGTVTEHATLAACVAWVRGRERAARSMRLSFGGASNDQA